MKKQKRKIKRRYKILAIILLFAIAFCIWQVPFSFWTGDPITISEHTTHVTQPLNDEGLINYRIAANQRMVEGTTVEENAFIDLVQAIEFIPPGPGLDDMLVTLGASPIKVGPALEHDLISKAYPGIRHDEYIEIYEVVNQRAWSADEYPELASALRGQRFVLDAVLNAVEKSNFCMPFDYDESELPTGINARFDVNNILRNLARVLQVKAFHEIGESQTSQALRCLRGMRQFDRHLRNTGYRHDWFVGINYADMAFQAERELLRSRQASADQLQRYATFLKNSAPDPLHFANDVDLYDRYYGLAVIQAFAHTPRFESVDFQMGVFQKTNDLANVFCRMHSLINWNQAMVAFNEYCDEMRDRLRMADGELDFLKRQKMYSAIQKDHGESQDQLLTNRYVLNALISGPSARGRWMGLYYTSYISAIFADLDEIDTRTRMKRDIAIVSALVEAFRLEKDRYPESLDQLVPQYLESVPLDRFTGGNLTYQAKDDGYQLRWSHEEAVIESGE